MQPTTVSDLTGRIKSVLESDFSFVYVTGEISNFKHHSSGHFYFALKDESAQISAMMWSSRNRQLSFVPKDGMQVVVKGKLTVYSPRGSYQIDVIEMSVAGIGDIYIAFEQLKEKLKKEGLFDESHKKPIPLFPERIVIITSETGAALQDFYRVASRRFPVARLMLINSKVQGVEAVPEIVNAIKTACSSKYSADVIVLARGGGSIEDLWLFNEEKVARAIYDATVPLVSAIGHEIDYTIADFVADLRAPTPSAAAEMVLPDINELRRDVDEAEDNLNFFVKHRIDLLSTALDNIERSYHFRKPAERIKELKGDIILILRRMKAAALSKSGTMSSRLASIEMSYHFKKPADSIASMKSKAVEFRKDLERITGQKIRNNFDRLNSAEVLLESYNPDNVLKRGYALISRGSEVISRNSRLKEEDEVNLKFFDGNSQAVIKSKN